MNALYIFFSCSSSPGHIEQDHSAHPIGDAECNICGMLVEEQPAPRGQVLYRDGSHEFTCGIHGLHSLVSAPNPNGTPLSVYVESLEIDFDERQPSFEARPWIFAEEAYFVPLAERKMVMGAPFLSYADAETAKSKAESLGVSAVRWAELLERDSIDNFTAD
jgi:copper chaperone NosL